MPEGIQQLLGKTLTKINYIHNHDMIFFITADGYRYKMYHHQD